MTRSNVFSGLTRLQVKLAEVLGGAERDHNHTVPENVLPCGHLESDMCAGDETVLLDHWMDSLHPSVPEVYPGVNKKVEKSGQGYSKGNTKINVYKFAPLISVRSWTKV